MLLPLVQRVKKGVVVAGAFLLLAATLAASVPVSAATTNSIYSYTLDGSSSTVSNGAAANSGVNITLAGNWTQSADGVHFAGDTTSQQSVGYGRPASGDTVNVPATSSVGVAAQFVFEGPELGTHCFPDSHNITQIGRFGDNLSQIKLQTSNCGDADWAIFPECRIAGDNSSIADLPFQSSQQLVKGETYIVRCYKTPDPVTGSPTLTLDVTHINTTYGNHHTSDNTLITPTGIIQSTAYLSVANKYQLPTIPNNTDQFVGDISKVAFCQATTTVAVATCLETELPAPAVPTPAKQWVANPSMETDLTQWQGQYGPSPYVSVARSTEQARTGSASVKVLGLTGANNQKSGVSDDSPKLVTNATAGEVYHGSVWVKPDVIGQKINFRLREWSGSTLITDNKVTLTPATTDWQEMTNAITATQNGTRLAFAVYGEDIDAGDYFYADDMSLESTLVSHEWATNTSLETNLTDWTGLFGSSPYVTVAHSTAAAHTGTGSVKITALTGANNLSSGFSGSDRVATDLVAGKTYHGSVWVKPSFVGQQIVLRMQEWKWNGVTSDMYNDVKVIHTAASTNWEQISGYLTAGTNDSEISFTVYGKGLDAGNYFYADDLSLVSLE